MENMTLITPDEFNALLEQCRTEKKSVYQLIEQFNNIPEIIKNIPLLNKEVSKINFISSGLLIKSICHRFEQTVYFRIENKVGALIIINNEIINMLEFKESLSLLCEEPWTMFENRVWTVGERDSIVICNLF